MKNQNRIAQRIWNEAIIARRQKKFVHQTSRINLFDDERTDLLRKMGTNKPGVSLGATIWLSENDVEQIELHVTTLTSPFLKKSITLYSVDVTDLGRRIAWLVDEVMKGHGESIRTPEEEWTDYQRRYEEEEPLDWQEDRY